MSAAGLPAPEPEELVRLRAMYIDLPAPSIKWRTAPGRRFLAALHKALNTFTQKQVAAALGVSTVAVRNMKNQNRTGRLIPLPTQQELAKLKRAWRTVEAAKRKGVPVRRNSHEFVVVHEALARLTPKYDLAVIAMQIRVESRRLERFTQQPITSAKLAAAVRQALPAPRPAPRTDSGAHTEHG